MIKENEIRLGNWFHHKAEWSTMQATEEIIEFDFQWDDTTWWYLGECLLFKENIEPISLTEEWLCKFGFEEELFNGEIHTGDYYKKHVGVLNIGWSNEFQLRFEMKCCQVTVKYVHQLQNLYHALTGEELQ